MRKMKFQKATKDNQQDHKKLGEEHNQIYGTGLSQTSPQFFPLIVIGKDNFV